MRALINNLRADISHNRERLFAIPDMRELLRDQHVKIATSILERHPEAARSAAHEHLDYLRKATLEVREAEMRLDISLRRLDRGGLRV